MKNHKMSDMKIYFYSCKKNINTYLLINEATCEAILIDPTDLPEYFIKKIETEHCILKAVCITNPNIEEIKRGVKTWQNVYDFVVFEPYNIFNDSVDYIKSIQFSSFDMESFLIKNKSGMSCMYKIENALFTGQSLLTLIFQFYSTKETFVKMKDFDENTVLFPLSGPLIALKTLKEAHLNQTSTKKS